MTPETLVSVIIPVFNGERFLAEAIASVLSQSHPHREIIVVDDGSSDRSLEAIPKLDEIRVLRQPNRGVAAARNRGVEESRGEFIAFLDQDDLWSPAKLSIQLEHFRNHPSSGYVMGHEELKTEAGCPDPVWLRKEFWDRPYPGFNLGTTLIRRSFYEKIGPFDPALRFCSDGDWLLRAAAVEPRRFLPQTLTQKRIHEHNESHQVSAMNVESFRIIKRSLDRSRSVPSISVVIPAFNSELHLGAALRSVLEQSSPAQQVLVVDDGSSDGSRAVASAFKEVELLCQTHQGAAAARNLGAAAATGDFIAFLDADDVWSADKLSLQRKLLSERPGTDLVFGHVEHFFSPELPEGLRQRLHCPAEILPGLMPSACLVRREAFSRIGGFNPELRLGEFIDWYHRARSGGLQEAMLPETLVRRRIHQNNMGIRERHHREDYLKVVKAALDRRRNSS